MPAAVGMELAIGVALGFGASLPLMGMQLAGQVADQQMGIGLGGIFNPDLGRGHGRTGQLFTTCWRWPYFVILGGHRVLLMTLVGSFGRIPLGGFTPDARLVQLMTGLMTSSFELAMRISAPLLCIVMLETVAMGFIARTVPQLNIMSVGFAIRIFLCAGVIIGSLSIITAVYAENLRRGLHLLEMYFGLGLMEPPQVV